MRANEFLTELFDPRTSFDLEWDDSFAPEEYHALAYDRQGRTINIGFVPIGADAVDIEFTRGGSHDITGRGDAERVFATVINAITTYLKNYRQPSYILFSGKETSRNKLYQRLVVRYAAGFGYQVTSQEELPEELRSMSLPKDVFILSKKAITEVINTRQIESDFHLEKEIDLEGVGPLKLVADNLKEWPSVPQFIVKVFLPTGENIGYFRFVVVDYEPAPRFKMFAKKTDPYVIGGNVTVWREYQRKGIAREVYNWVKSWGNDLRPSPTQTDAGKAMWRSFDRELTNEVALGPDDLVDVFVRGKHKGEPFTRLVARGFPNKNIPLLINKLETKYNINPNAIVYGPSRMMREDSIDENFKDGKNPGRKGLAKRSGVNCKASVSTLRRVAKNSSGEKQRMAHWCANMKAGRKK